MRLCTQAFWPSPPRASFLSLAFSPRCKYGLLNLLWRRCIQARRQLSSKRSEGQPAGLVLSCSCACASLGPRKWSHSLLRQPLPSSRHRLSIWTIEALHRFSARHPERRQNLRRERPADLPPLATHDLGVAPVLALRERSVLALQATPSQMADDWDEDASGDVSPRPSTLAPYPSFDPVHLKAAHPWNGIISVPSCGQMPCRHLRTFLLMCPPSRSGYGSRQALASTASSR